MREKFKLENFMASIEKPQFSTVFWDFEPY